jgi:hypothetical protein
VNPVARRAFEDELDNLLLDQDQDKEVFSEDSKEADDYHF